jgi:hypothetical protein
MKPRLALLLALALLGVNPAATPLIVGAVRDQYGVPIEGAAVRIETSAGTLMSTVTESDGTFALEAANASRATISCSFCRTTEAHVGSDGTIVAIVTRYSAIASPQLSQADVRHVPSADAPSTLALTPYAVLNRSKRLLPGPQLSDRGVSRTGGLAVIDATPSYDIVANLSPYYVVPQRYTGFVATAPQSDAYVYDTVANGGTFFVNAGDGAAVYGGGIAGAQASSGARALGGAAAFSSDAVVGASRALVQGQATMRDVLATAGVATASANVLNSPTDLDTSVSSARFSLEHERGLDAGISGWIDRGTYDIERGGPYVTQSAWSDVETEAYARSDAVVAPFAEVAYLHSTGAWNSATFFSAFVNQTRGSVGVSSKTAMFDTIAQAGVTKTNYIRETTTSYHNDDALVSATFHPDAHWSVEGSLSTGYRLPTLLLVYASPPLPDNAYSDRDSTLETTAWYTDAARVRVGITALSRRTAGLDEGTIASTGASLSWQIAPQLSLRAWTLNVAPSVIARPAARFDPQPLPATPASAWLTYENNGVRADLIWRRDLIDWVPSSHVDAAISGPLTRRLGWFVSTERRWFSTVVDAGIRF